MILLCAATRMELDACLGPLGESFDSLPMGPKPWTRRRGRVLLAATGPGIPLTLSRLVPLVLAERPSALVDIGIAGAYAGSALSIGDLVAGESEQFGDLGMETTGPEAFLPLAGFDWSDPMYARPLVLSMAPLGPTPGFKRARGSTVNACTGTAATGARRRSLTGADFETMEGAAVALAGLETGTPVAEVRAISNMAADRDMRPENVGSALRALGGFVSAWLERSL